eukprot:TRINITY_DN23154_c0_g1_i1.p1 TRINITY_DN23154_c0_g1~~TRINITY_DN23154_c0_g1_i1.p1  ORF type:complete len:1076 (-),score=163.04 TRINITY_DN23154_c0_g1_i1:199-3138(-)
MRLMEPSEGQYFPGFVSGAKDKVFGVNQHVNNNRKPGDQVLDLRLPGFRLDEHVSVHGHNMRILVRVFSEDTPFAEPLVRRCSEAQQVLDLVLGVLQSGAESVNLTLGYEMLQLTYDKMDVMNETEAIGKNWIVSNYIWGPVRNFRIWPEPDSLAPYFDRLGSVPKRKVKEVKQQIIQELYDKSFTELEIAKFLECTGGEDMHVGLLEGSTAKLLRILAREATQRGFWFQETDENFIALDGNSHQGIKKGRRVPPAPNGAKISRIDETVKSLVKAMAYLAADVNAWRFLIDWEPLHIKDMHESLHEAQRYAMLCDEAAHVRFTLKTVDFMQKMTAKQRLSSEKFITLDWFAIVMANKQVLDELVEGYIQGSIPRDRFEHSLWSHCQKVVDMITNTLLPVAEHNEDLEKQVMCLRQIADYRRYTYYWCASKRRVDLADAIQQLYQRATQLAQQLPPKNVVGTGVYLNLSAWHAECMCHLEHAADACEAGVEWGHSKPINRMLTPSEIFNWTLLEKNLEAYESQLIFLNLTFSRESFEEHKAALGACWQDDVTNDRSRAALDAPQLNVRMTVRSTVHMQQPEEPAVQNTRSAGLGQRGDCASEWNKAKLAAVAIGSLVAGLCVDRHENRLGWGLPETSQPAGGSVSETNLDTSSRVSMSSGPMQPTSASMRKSRLSVLPSRDSGYSVRNEPPEQLDAHVVNRWLSSQPLFTEQVPQEEMETQKEEAAQLTAENIAQQARWVETAAPQGACGNDNGVSFEVALVLRPNKKVLCHFSGRGTANTPVSQNAAAARRQTRVTLRQEDAAPRWHKVLSDHLKTWSQQGQSKTVTIDQRIVLMQLLSSLSDDGAVRRVLRLGDYRLCPGEVLQMVDVLADKSPRVAVQLMRSGSLALPLQLHFANPLRITECSVLDDVPYVVHHANFVGFRDTGTNLFPSEQFKSLETVREQVEDHRALEKQSKVPRRIPGLSARRSPMLAMYRGCQ